MLRRSRLSRFAALLLSAVTALPTPLLAKEPRGFCGTERTAVREELFLHRRAQALRAKLGVRAATGPVGKDIGNIAVMYDSGGVVTRRNPFNLLSKRITFTPAPGFTQYRFQVDDVQFDQVAADNGAVLTGMDDDDTRRVRLPFAFPFYGARYNELWVNSDGNVTFGEGDNVPAPKSVGLLSGGPPRIAPLFVDLDPSRAPQGVRVYSEAARLVVSWYEVPLFGSFSGSQIVQLKLHADGRMEFDYQRTSTSEAVVGISPGSAKGETELVSFLDGAPGPFSATVAERFTNVDSLDSVLLSQRFYQTHDDSYDYLAVYNNFGLSARSFAVATEVTVRSDHRAGFGDVPVNTGKQYGSAKRLQAFLNLGPLSNYPRDANGPVPLRSGTGDTPVTVLLHEVGHLFLALASVRDPVDPTRRPMLGTALAHWSFNFNSEASFLEGNRIQDNGDTTSPRFQTTATVERFSALDQYLMGLRPPNEVPPTFLVERSGRSNEEPPFRGATFNGTRRNITIDELIEAEGRRAPDHTVAQKRFRVALVLLVREGTEPTAEQLEQLEAIRAAAEARYAEGTDNLGALDTTLKRNVALSVWPAAGIINGTTLNAAVRLDKPADSPLTVLLRTSRGVASAPASVTIPAGATQAVVPIRGLAEGVETLTAEPSNSAYRTDEARIQVAPRSAVRLEVEGGDLQTASPGQPLADAISIRATDINLIPYPGLSLRGSVSSGSLAAASVTTDEEGIARFTWTTGTGNNAFRASFEGSSSVANVATAQRPTFLAGSVLNAASYQPGLSPGALTVVFGAALAGGQTLQATTSPWPTQLGDLQVLINNTPVPVYYAVDGQVSFYVPASLSGALATVRVRSRFGESDPIEVPVQPVQPGLFYSPVTGEASVLIAGTAFLTSQQPAKPGDYLAIYATGLGPLVTSTASELEETVERPIVTIGGVPAEVVYSGVTPGIAGLYQINARVSADTPSGVVKVRIRMAGRDSNEADITIAR